jgi:hypothetical protein
VFLAALTTSLQSASRWQHVLTRVLVVVHCWRRGLRERFVLSDELPTETEVGRVGDGSGGGG